jgi:signal peptidase I
MDKKKLLAQAKAVWTFIWDEDSIWSWMVNILLAFLIIKFLIYPGIGILLGTNLPVVAVISESMTHEGDFETWWNSPAMCESGNIIRSCTQREWYVTRGISEDQFKKYIMKNGFNKGDIILLKGVTFDELKVGDVLVYQSKLPYPVIHRVIAKNDVIETKGDHNQKQILDARLNEKYITKDQILGKAWIRIPYLGYVKIWFTQFVQCITLNGCRFG